MDPVLALHPAVPEKPVGLSGPQCPARLAPGHCDAASGLLLYGLLTVLCEWKQIQIPNYKKILYVFTFPLFMFTYIPISLAALVRKVEWKPIYHTGSQKTLGKAA